MRKKLFKYIKFLISMVLILGLVAPSYASLSASDGSAFVTKAEFDSALADFNSRLTTFEAGINSKIDSQVTTYLDRNGIWNGKTQIFSEYTGVTQSVWDYFNCGESSSTTKMYDMKDGVWTTFSPNEGEKVTVIRPKNVPYREKICTLTKSGLCCVNFDFLNAMDGSHRCQFAVPLFTKGWLHTWNWNQSFYSNIVEYTQMTGEYEIKNQESLVEFDSGTRLWGAGEVTSGSVHASLPYSPPVGKRIAYFFVEKGNELYVETKTERTIRDYNSTPVVIGDMWYSVCIRNLDKQFSRLPFNYIKWNDVKVY